MTVHFPSKSRLFVGYSVPSWAFDFSLVVCTKGLSIAGIGLVQQRLLPLLVKYASEFATLVKASRLIVRSIISWTLVTYTLDFKLTSELRKLRRALMHCQSLTTAPATRVEAGNGEVARADRKSQFRQCLVFVQLIHRPRGQQISCTKNQNIA